MKIIDEFKNKKREFEEKKGLTEKKKNVYSLFACLCFIVCVMVYLFLNYDTIKEATDSINSNLSNVNTSVASELNEYTNNYSREVKIISDNGILLVNIEKDNLKELIKKKTSDSLIEYAFDGTNYYEINNKTLIIDDKVKIFDEYDTTFLDLNNILKLIDIANKSSFYDGEYKVDRYRASISETVRLYNEINNTKHGVSKDDYIDVDLYYLNNKIKLIKMDLTSLYKVITEYDYIMVNYEIKLDNLNQIVIENLTIPTN